MWIIRSITRGYETHQQETIFSRLTDTHKAPIDQFLREDVPDADDSLVNEANPIEVLILTHLKADTGSVELGEPAIRPLQGEVQLSYSSFPPRHNYNTVTSDSCSVEVQG